MSISPTSISPIVDDNYRLRSSDLEGMARHVVIANVTYQGVERMIPVLHFVGQSKRLVLSPDQVEQIIDITGTTLLPQWKGTTIVLQPGKGKDAAHILIKSITQNKHARPMPIYMPDDKRGWYFALTVVGTLLAASVAYAALNIESILAAVQQLRDNWLLR